MENNTIKECKIDNNGEGTFGVVRLFQDKKTKEKFAIKILNKKKIIKNIKKKRVKFLWKIKKLK